VVGEKLADEHAAAPHGEGDALVVTLSLARRIARCYKISEGGRIHAAARPESF
jgi:hypothetical protein